MKTDEPSINLRNLRDVNKILNCDWKYYVRNYTSTNRLLKVAEWVVARKLGFKTKVARPQKLRRATRIKDKINLLRRDFNCLDWWSKKELYQETIKEQLENRYGDRYITESSDWGTQAKGRDNLS